MIQKYAVTSGTLSASRDGVRAGLGAPGHASIMHASIMPQDRDLN